MVWRATGQIRYQERHWRQQEQMYERLPYHFTEWTRRSCTVNHYDSSLGKNHVAYDEDMELGNRFFAQFPMVNDRDAFLKKGQLHQPGKTKQAICKSVSIQRRTANVCSISIGFHSEQQSRKQLDLRNVLITWNYQRSVWTQVLSSVCAKHYSKMQNRANG